MAKTKKGVLFSGSEARKVYRILHPRRGEESHEEKEYIGRLNRWYRSMPRLDGGFPPI